MQIIKAKLFFFNTNVPTIPTSPIAPSTTNHCNLLLLRGQAQVPAPRRFQSRYCPPLGQYANMFGMSRGTPRLTQTATLNLLDCGPVPRPGERNTGHWLRICQSQTSRLHLQSLRFENPISRFFENTLAHVMCLVVDPEMPTLPRSSDVRGDIMASDLAALLLLSRSALHRPTSFRRAALRLRGNARASHWTAPGGSSLLRTKENNMYDSVEDRRWCLKAGFLALGKVVGCSVSVSSPSTPLHGSAPWAGSLLSIRITLISAAAGILAASAARLDEKQPVS